MTRQTPVSGTGLIILSLLAAALLSVMPWPDMLAWFRPQWVALVMIYWVLALPNRVGVFWGLFVGLLQDVLLSSPFGQHALALVLVCYLALLVQQRMHRMDGILQSLTVFMLVGVSLWVNYILQYASGHAYLPPYVMLLLALASGVFWMPVSGVLHFVQRLFLVR